MALASGTRLGPYEVTAQIGVGGMGEVYRATDTNLKRQVAIKVLPASVAGDAERLARFQREAEVLASLNHAHIAAIYGLERADGTTALVMELVEGPTLADRIAQGAIPIDEALPIAKQMAEALEAAHEQGIIHRDLKPANIKVRADGTVKVLDFGLAKALEPTGGMSASASMSPTITTPAMTQAGMILGTAAYMSPEQAKGRPVDKRADIWAFGCVLYEMLSGRRAFDGEDMIDVLGAVARLEPDWAALPGHVPAAVRRLLHTCLVKDPRRRVADVSVIQFVLAETASLGLGSDAGADARDAAVTEPQIRAAVALARRTLLRRRVWPAAAVMALVAALLVAAAWGVGPPRPAPELVRFELTLPIEQLLNTSSRQVIAISPDGSHLVHVPGAARQRLYIRSMSEFESREIAGSETSARIPNPVFSPDGASLAFFGDGAIRRIATVGGTAVTLCPAEAPYGMTWDTSGIVVGQGNRGVIRCSANGGPPEQLAKVAEGEEAYGPQILPGGEALLFTVARAADAIERWDKAAIVVQALTTGERHTVMTGGSDARYVPTGHLLYAQRGALFAVPFDLGRHVTTGGPVPVVEGIRRAASGQTGVAQLATSGTGSLVYVQGPPGGSVMSEWFIGVADRAGVVTRLPLPAGPYVHVRASRDGTRLAIDSDDGKEATIWIYELAGTSALRRLTFGGRNRLPVWSPDGQRVAFQSDREGDTAIFVQRADGTGPVERLTKPGSGETHVPEAWSPDGRHLAYSVATAKLFALWVRSIADGKAARFGDVQSVEPIGAAFSPDGRWLAYHTVPNVGAGAAPSSGVFVQPFPATGARYQAPRVRLDFQPVWSRDGAELVYVSSAASGQLAAVHVSRNTGLTFNSPQLLPAAVTGGRTSVLTRAFDTLPDGKFVGPLADSGPDGSSGSALSEIRVVLNWFEELKRLVPTH